jgi:hypothetical protein
MRVQVIFPDEWKPALKAAAEKSGKTVSGWIAECAAKQLPANVVKRLPTLRKRGEKLNGG